MASTNDTVFGFIGLGQMGYGMAMNLRKKLPSTAQLVVCELVEARREQFVSEAGKLGPVTVAESPKEVAEKASIIITMLPKGAHVKDAYTNPTTGILSAEAKRQRLFLECSTIDVATSVGVGGKVRESGMQFIDAPVSGGPNGANAGTLTMMVGGTEALYQEALPYLQMMGKNIFFCGVAGAGLATKQINNYLSSVCTIGVCEALNMGIKYGLEPKTLSAVINSSSGRCYNSMEQNPVKGVTPGAASENDFQGGFSVELCKGVLDMAVELGKGVGAQSVFADSVLRVYEKAISDDRTKGKDSRSVFKLFVDGDA